MKVKVILCLFVIVLFGSNSYAQKGKCIACICQPSAGNVWKVNTSKEAANSFLIRGDSVPDNSSNFVQVIARINAASTIKVKMTSYSGGIIYIKILTVELFTQQIGEQAAKDFLAMLVYNITEIKEVKGVFVQFEPGKFGGEPGLRDRKTFAKDYMICNKGKQFVE